MNANSLSDPNLLYVGQVLQLPGCNNAPAAVQPPSAQQPPMQQPPPAPSKVDPPATDQGQRNYTVRAGDTLSAIAAKFGINASAVALANGIANPNWIYVGQELYGLGDALHGILVKTNDPYNAEQVKQSIMLFLQPPEFAQTWIDMNNQYFEAVRLERTVMFFLLFFIVVVAAFGIMNTLITVTVQKTRDIGIMKAIGANIWQIVWVFLGQGIIVGIFGTLMGLGLGMTLIRYRNGFSHWLANIGASCLNMPLTIPSSACTTCA